MIDLEFESKNILSDNQREQVYLKSLQPLKMKIAKITLYDPETAVKFLQKYNEIVKNADSVEQDMYQVFPSIVELENDLKQYEEQQGGIMMRKEESRMIVQGLGNLKESCDELSEEEFLQRFTQVKSEIKSKIHQYSYQDRERIENQLYAVYAKLIMRLSNLSDGQYDLKDVISKEDESGLNLVITEKLIDFMQKEDYNAQTIANKLKTEMALGSNYIYSPETWQLLQNKKVEKSTEISRYNEEQEKNDLAIPKKRGFFHNLKEMFLGKEENTCNKVIKIAGKEMRVSNVTKIGENEVSVSDLAKIDMSFLAKNMPVELLEAIENLRLKEEGKEVEEKYLPDSKTLIYDFFAKEVNVEKSRDVCFENELGVPLKMKLDSGYEIWLYNSEQKNLGYVSLTKNDREKIVHTIMYAQLVDIITNSNLKQEVSNELGTCLEKIMDKELRHEKNNVSLLLNKLPLLQNLFASRTNIVEQIKDSRADFIRSENAKREKFYKEHEFNNSIKCDVDINLIQALTKDEEESSKDEGGNCGEVSSYRW